MIKGAIYQESMTEISHFALAASKSFIRYFLYIQTNIKPEIDAGVVWNVVKVQGSGSDNYTPANDNIS